jgi:hypothetical protein
MFLLNALIEFVSNWKTNEAVNPFPADAGGRIFGGWIY